MTSDVLERLWVALGTHLWQTSLILVALFIVARMWRRAPAGLLNALFWLGLAKLLTPMPLLKSLAGGAVDSVVKAVTSVGVATRATVPLLENTVAVLDPAEAVLGAGRHLGGGLPAILTVLWVSGALVMTAAWLLRARPRRRTHATPLLGAAPELRRRLVEPLRSANVPESSVLVTESHTIPHVAGLLTPRVVLPRRLVEEIDGAALRSILLHENAHRRRREPLRLLLARTASVVFFFYPLVWPLLKRLRETGEMTCDDAVLAGGVRPGTYARALASVLDMGLTAAPSSAALDRRSPSLMRRRLMRLNEPRRCTMKLRHRAALSLAVVCVLMASVLSLSSAAGDPSTEAKAPPAPVKPAPSPPDAPKPPPEMLDLFISKMVPPEYPEEPRAKGLEAIVFVELTLADDLSVASVREKTVVVGRPPLEVIKVGKEGKVIEPVEEEGMEAYHQVFVEAAMEAALQWQLEARPEGASVGATTVVVPIQFRLEDSGEQKAVESEGDESK